MPKQLEISMLPWLRHRQILFELPTEKVTLGQQASRQPEGQDSRLGHQRFKGQQ